MLSYKYILNPTFDQINILTDQLEQCRLLYNFLLEQKNNSRKLGNFFSWYDSSALIPQYVIDHPEIKYVYSKVRQMVNYILYSNLKGLSELKKKGYKTGKLRFKGKGWYKTLNFNQSGFKIDCDSNTIKFSHIGIIKCRFTRSIPLNSKIKGIVIKRSEQQWYAIIQVENEIQPLPKTGKSVGIDMGINALTTDSDGIQIENPKYIDQSTEKIKKYQRELSRKIKYSSNYQKIKQKLAKIHYKVVNQRKDYLHKISRYYINNYDNIYIENLDILSMTKKQQYDKRSKKTLHRHELDASWGQLTAYLLYKAENAGRQLVLVDPKGTSQRCSQCDQIVKKDLTIRIHECPFCGFVTDRDYNASLNIMKIGDGLAIMPIESISLSKFSSSDVVSGQILVMK